MRSLAQGGVFVSSQPGQLGSVTILTAEKDGVKPIYIRAAFP